MAKRHWNPSIILRVVREAANTSTSPVLVKTDNGQGMVKFMGNPAGSHALACEWIGTSLAGWLGIETFEYAIVPYSTDLRIILDENDYAILGPAFITKWDSKGSSWSGDPSLLKKVENKKDFTRIVFLDTWLLNRDRHCEWEHVEPVERYDNIFLSISEKNPKNFTLRAIDHGHTITYGGNITESIVHRNTIERRITCGLFPEFRCHLDSDVSTETRRRMRSISEKDVEKIVASIPSEWGIGNKERDWLKTFVLQRAKFVSEFLHDVLFPPKKPSGDMTLFDNIPEGEL